jgi:hypothetical protein
VNPSLQEISGSWFITIAWFDEKANQKDQFVTRLGRARVNFCDHEASPIAFA